MRVHHIGYLVKEINKAKVDFERLGYTLSSDIIFDEYRQVEICFLEKDGYTIELVSPTSKESVVSNLIKKYGNAPYHICYETSNFEVDLKALIDEHCVVCSEKHSAVALNDKNVCFIIHPYLGMIELLEN